MSRKQQQRGEHRRFNNKDSSNSKSNTATKKPGIIDKDLQFYISEQQAEKFNQLIKHLMVEAQKDYGYSMAYVIEYRKEYVFETLTKEELQLSDKKAEKVQQDTYNSIFAQEIKAYTQKKSQIQEEQREDVQNNLAEDVHRT